MAAATGCHDMCRLFCDTGDWPTSTANQFEEVFTAPVDDTAREQQLDNLTALACQPGVRIVVVLWSDVVGACVVHPRLAQLIGEGTVLVGPMRPEEIRRAIELPARHVVGLHVEPALVDAIVSDVEITPAPCHCCPPPWLRCGSDARARRSRARRITAPGDFPVARLASALDWTGERLADLTGVEREFLAASRDFSDRELMEEIARADWQAHGRHRLRAALAAAFSLLLVATAAGIVASGGMRRVRPSGMATAWPCTRAFPVAHSGNVAGIRPCGPTATKAIMPLRRTRWGDRAHCQTGRSHF